MFLSILDPVTCLSRLWRWPGHQLLMNHYSKRDTKIQPPPTQREMNGFCLHGLPLIPPPVIPTSLLRFLFTLKPQDLLVKFHETKWASGNFFPSVLFKTYQKTYWWSQTVGCALYSHPSCILFVIKQVNIFGPCVLSMKTRSFQITLLLAVKFRSENTHRSFFLQILFDVISARRGGPYLSKGSVQINQGQGFVPPWLLGQDNHGVSLEKRLLIS